MGDNCQIKLEVEWWGRVLGCRIVPHHNLWYNNCTPILDVI